MYFAPGKTSEKEQAKSFSSGFPQNSPEFPRIRQQQHMPGAQRQSGPSLSHHTGMIAIDLATNYSVKLVSINLNTMNKTNRISTMFV